MLCKGVFIKLFTRRDGDGWGAGDWEGWAKNIWHSCEGGQTKLLIYRGGQKRFEVANGS